MWSYISVGKIYSEAPYPASFRAASASTVGSIRMGQITLQCTYSISLLQYGYGISLGPWYRYSWNLYLLLLCYMRSYRTHASLCGDDRGVRTSMLVNFFFLQCLSRLDRISIDRLTQDLLLYLSLHRNRSLCTVSVYAHIWRTNQESDN
jgi:hypothetical protein